jgi:hypothetical protein
MPVLAGMEELFRSGSIDQKRSSVNWPLANGLWPKSFSVTVTRRLGLKPGQRNHSCFAVHTDMTSPQTAELTLRSNEPPFRSTRDGPPRLPLLQRGPSALDARRPTARRGQLYLGRARCAAATPKHSMLCGQTQRFCGRQVNFRAAK